MREVCSRWLISKSVSCPLHPNTYLDDASSKQTTTTKSTTSKLSTALSTSLKPTISTSNDTRLSQCSNYMLITDETRRSTHAHYTGCDKDIFQEEITWVRFSGAAGSRLAPGPMEPFHCGTQATGWYKGTYPTVAGTTTRGTVCYSWPGNMCLWSNQISISHCDGYYVFALRAPPACFLRYCTVWPYGLCASLYSLFCFTLRETVVTLWSCNPIDGQYILFENKWTRNILTSISIDALWPIHSLCDVHRNSRITRSHTQSCIDKHVSDNCIRFD